MQHKILFRADAGPQAGLGHLQRCLSLGKALEKRGAVCAFLSEPGPAAERIAGSGFSALPAGESERILRDGWSGVVIDSYRAGPDDFSALRGAGLFAIAIDDQNRFPFPCQMVINGGLRARGLDYRSSSGDTLFLLGPEWALLPTEFWDPATREIPATVGNLLLTLGGSDGLGRMPGLIRQLDEWTEEFTLTAVIGPFQGNGAQVRQAAEGSRRPVRLIEAPLSLHREMLQADLAVSTGGQTLYQLAATGTPTAAFAAAENQRANLRAFIEAGAVLDGPDAARSLLNDRERRLRLSEAGSGLIDGRGAIRTAEAIIQALSGEPAPTVR